MKRTLEKNAASARVDLRLGAATALTVASLLGYCAAAQTFNERKVP
jgi:hypothetical protein